MSNSQVPYIVGRQSEIAQFSSLLQGKTAYPLLNIYGPGGIGKTIVGEKMQLFALENQYPFAFIDGNRQDLTPHKILGGIVDGLKKQPAFEDMFASFTNQYQNYQLVCEILELGGGLPALFNNTGRPVDPESFDYILASLRTPINLTVQQIISNRFSVERYLRNIERELTDALVSGLTTLVTTGLKPPSILIDTYEQMEGHDDWICRNFYPKLPPGVKIVILGRNALARVNFDWTEMGHNIFTMELPELAEVDAKAYLQFHGLKDPIALEKVYQFTGGYPLLLMLVVHLAKESGGWQSVGTIDNQADRDRVATQLLERILREEKVQEVQAFLEKGVVARWFTPEIISVILEIDAEEGRRIYNKLGRHSFVERHPNGLKFHDKIRELLTVRLKFTNETEFNHIEDRLKQYFAAKAGIGESDEAGGPVLLSEGGDQTEEVSLGALLKFYRRQSSDPARGGKLTQARLAELLEGEGAIYTDAMISQWESNRVKISLDNRSVLIALIRIFVKCGGLTTTAEAQNLLFAAGHRDLDSGEIRAVFRK